MLGVAYILALTSTFLPGVIFYICCFKINFFFSIDFIATVTIVKLGSLISQLNGKESQRVTHISQRISKRDQS